MHYHQLVYHTVKNNLRQNYCIDRNCGKILFSHLLLAAVISALVGQ